MIGPQSLYSMKKAYDNAAASLNDATEILSQTNHRIFSRQPESDFGAVAKSALDALHELNGQCEGQSCGMGAMMSGFRRLSARQSMINAATGELLRDMLGSAGSEGRPGENGPGGKEAGNGAGSRRSRQEAAAAQKAIADELRRLADKYGKDAGASLDKKARALEEEAKTLSKMLDNPSQELRDRQDKFLSRMLETSLSQHKQDEGKEERKSQSAKSVFSPRQADERELGASGGLDAYYRLRQRAFAGNFPESYRGAVKNYFDSLGVLFLKEK